MGSVPNMWVPQHSLTPRSQGPPNPPTGRADAGLWALKARPNFTSTESDDCIDFLHKSYFLSSASFSHVP